MIHAKTAMSFDRVAWREQERAAQPVAALRDSEKIAVEYLDAAVETGIWKDFCGEPFEFRVEMSQLAMLLQEPLTQEIVVRVLGALRQRYEEGGWRIGVFLVRDPSSNDVTCVQMVFAPRVVEVEVAKESAAASAEAPAAEAATAPAPTPAPRRLRAVGDKPRVLLVPDVPGWAFDVNARDLAATLADVFDFGFFYTENFFRGERPRWDDYDVVYEFFHRNPPMGMPYDRAVGALRSEWWDPQARTPPTEEQVARVNKYRGFQVACERNLREYGPRCPGVRYLTNPVNAERFKPYGATDHSAAVVASWNGNAGHKAPDGRYIKHYHDVVVPACLRAKVRLVVAEYGTKTGPQRRRGPDEMPAFYHQAHVALCASEYESASNSVMEAMASGLALVATDVGNHRELRDAQIKHFGDTGIVLVDRDVDAFAEVLRALTPEKARRMGEVNRAEIVARWSWAAWRDRYHEFLEMAL